VQWIELKEAIHWLSANFYVKITRKKEERGNFRVNKKKNRSCYFQWVQKLQFILIAHLKLSCEVMH